MVTKHYLYSDFSSNIIKHSFFITLMVTLIYFVVLAIIITIYKIRIYAFIGVYNNISVIFTSTHAPSYKYIIQIKCTYNVCMNDRMYIQDVHN